MRLVAISGLVAVLLVFGACGGPEDDVAQYFSDMTEIMEDSMDSPADGIDDLRHYVRENLPEALSLLGHVLVELDKIEDADDRKERVAEMLEALKEPLAEFTKVGKKFEDKVEGDKDAMKKLKEFEKNWESIGEAWEKFTRDLERN